MTEYHADHLPDAVRDHLAAKPPNDVVPNPPLTRDEILALDALADAKQVVVCQSGAITNEGVGPAEFYLNDAVTAPVLPRAVVQAAELSDADIPNSTITEE